MFKLRYGHVWYKHFIFAVIVELFYQSCISEDNLTIWHKWPTLILQKNNLNASLKYIE